jgi:hypothetical protein
MHSSAPSVSMDPVEDPSDVGFDAPEIANNGDWIATPAQPQGASDHHICSQLASVHTLHGNSALIVSHHSGIHTGLLGTKS